ncbi:hypothetical protein SAMN05660420_02920 [Desulfuromusa kysingii]|uniref:Probable membrane transporter protein n=1 Tax=Desulfuromusa kysingii TaxID=37625 RepID=A0A1H4DF57_9BACT|nr:sulfite exporter TauE/SafE family protein [Desulfuromusa kysingii]SEA71247.1 hypothetical protein SAMN05660420_02920 [Desulfuromusa kysingii]
MDIFFDPSILATLAVLAFSTTIRSVFGFGDALIAMPLLAMILGLKTATPLVALIAFTIATIILLSTWRSLKVRSAFRLIISTMVGIPLGIVLLKGVDERIMQFLLACVLLLFSGFNLSNLVVPKLKSEKSSYLFGFVAGLLGGAYNTNGPPVVLFASMRDWPPAEFRATLQGYFFVTGFMLLSAHALGGLWNQRVFTLYGLSLPVVIISIWLGSKLHKKVSPEKFRKAIHILLVLIAAMLLFKALSG